MKERILIAEDETNINNLLRLHLINEGYEVTQAFDGMDALKKFESNEFDLLILDVMMPIIDGFTLLEIIRKESELPILFITARVEESDKILGLGLGADDYVVKPFSPIEVVSRVKAHLRRYLNYTNKQHQTVHKNGVLEVHIDNFIVLKNNEELKLNPKEFKILCFLIENIGRIFTKEQLYENVWGEEYYEDSNTIMVHMSHLRDRIEDNPRKPIYIKTIKGLGYRMEKVD